jgi:23S rRNA maturation-related 3'-5' exoribonuclease YhaM
LLVGRLNLLAIPIQIRYRCSVFGRRRQRMAQKRISEILKLVEFLNEEVKEVSKKLSRVTPREISEKLGALALLREKNS